MSFHINLSLMRQEENEQCCYGKGWIFNFHCLTSPPFVSLQTIRHSRPGLLKAGDPGLPWLADSWPSTSLPANGGLGSPKGGSNFGRGGKKHKQAGGGGRRRERADGEKTVLATPGGTVLMLIRREEQ